jgi:hypothetical protein
LKWLKQKIPEALNTRVSTWFFLLVLLGGIFCSVVSSYENASKLDDLAEINSGFFVSKEDVDRLQDKAFKEQLRGFLTEKGILTKSCEGLVYYYISDEEIEQIRNPELKWLIKRFVTEPLQRTLFPQKPAPRIYVVQPGDTLWDIAKQHGMSVDQLRYLNDLMSTQPIYPGQKLLVSPEYDQ